VSVNVTVDSSKFVNHGWIANCKYLCFNNYVKKSCKNIVIIFRLYEKNSYVSLLMITCDRVLVKSEKR